MIRHVVGEVVRRKDELNPCHYLVFIDKLKGSLKTKQLTFALSELVTNNFNQCEMLSERLNTAS